MLKVIGRGPGPKSALSYIGVLLAIAALASLIAVRLLRCDDRIRHRCDVGHVVGHSAVGVSQVVLGTPRSG